MSSSLLKQNKQAIRSALYACAFFMLVTFGYFVFKPSYANDSLIIAQNQEIAYKISLGRFAQPLYWQLRGYLAVPFLNGMFIFAFLTLSVIIVLLALRLHTVDSIVIVSGAIIVNMTMITEVASFIHDADSCALALLMGLGGIAVSARKPRMLPLGAVFICLSLGLYQAYIQSAAAFALILLISRLFDGEHPFGVVKLGLRLLATLVAGLLLYAACSQIAYRLFSVSASSAYNGLSSVGDYSDYSISSLVIQAWLTPLHSLLTPMTLNPRLALACRLLLTLTGAFCALSLIARRQPKGLCAFLFAGLLVLLPFSMSFVLVISKGLLHDLMLFAYAFAHILLALIIDRFADQAQARFPRACLLRPVALALTCLLFFQNIVQANQFYMKRDLDYQATLSAMTRVLETAEQTDGYVPGVTPVVIIGTLINSSIAMQRSDFDLVFGVMSIDSTYSTTYEATHNWYFAEALGYPIRLVSDIERLQLVLSRVAADVPAYPADGYCTMIDGKLFIRLS